MTTEQGPPRPLRDRCRIQPVNLAELRARRDNRPRLHDGCVDSETYAAECSARVNAEERERVNAEAAAVTIAREVQRRAAAEERAADAESQGRANFDGARRVVERRTQQRDDARALTVGLLRVLDAAADALDAGVNPARVAEDLRRVVQPHYLEMVQG